jgi:hypothetical protein
MNFQSILQRAKGNSQKNNAKAEKIAKVTKETKQKTLQKQTVEESHLQKTLEESSEELKAAAEALKSTKAGQQKQYKVVYALSPSQKREFSQAMRTKAEIQAAIRNGQTNPDFFVGKPSDLPKTSTITPTAELLKLDAQERRLAQAIRTAPVNPPNRALELARKEPPRKASNISTGQSASNVGDVKKSRAFYRDFVRPMLQAQSVSERTRITQNFQKSLQTSLQTFANDKGKHREGTGALATASASRARPTSQGDYQSKTAAELRQDWQRALQARAAPAAKATAADKDKGRRDLVGSRQQVEQQVVFSATPTVDDTEALPTEVDSDDSFIDHTDSDETDTADDKQEGDNNGDRDDDQDDQEEAKSVPSPHKRRKFHRNPYMEDDDLMEDDLSSFSPSQIRNVIQTLFQTRHHYDSDDGDDAMMEASFQQIQREETLAAKIAQREDDLEERKEREAKLKRKMLLAAVRPIEVDRP